MLPGAVNILCLNIGIVKKNKVALCRGLHFCGMCVCVCVSNN